MLKVVIESPGGPRLWRRLFVFCVMVLIAVLVGAKPEFLHIAMAKNTEESAWVDEVTGPGDPSVDEQIEQEWKPDYLDLATGDPDLVTEHGVYAWPFDLDSIGWSMQSYQSYGGTPYFHHGMDMMKIYGTDVYNRSGGQVVNIENYYPGWDLYWEVAVLDPYGYIWQYHHIHMPTIPQVIWDKYYEYLADPVNGGFIPADTYIGDIIEWPVWSYGKQFNHIHLNILAAGGVFVNGFEFHNPLPDTDGPEIQEIGLLQNHQILSGNTVEGDYSLYVRARDLILDDVYYLPPWEIVFSVDGGPVQTTWRFDALPGGADDTAYLDDFYVVPPTCGNYDCREYYIDLGFIPDSLYEFPDTGGTHSITVGVRDYAGNVDSQSFTYTVIGPPPGIIVGVDDFENDLGWAVNPNGTDTATSGIWERGNPEATYFNGPKQLGETTSGVNDLVTGRLAGGDANSNDIDGGVTSIRSPQILLPDIILPGFDFVTLSFRSYLAHGSNSTIEDYLRLTVTGSTSATVFEELGGPEDDDGIWDINNINLEAFAGEAVNFLFEATDAGSDSLVEAGIDDFMIVSNHAPTADLQTVITPEDNGIDITLSGTDPDGDPLIYTLITYPSHGTLSDPPWLTYMPFENYNGPDSFTFIVSDGQATSEPASVNIEVTAVNDAPVADPQSLSTLEDTPLDILLSGSDVENDPLTFTIEFTPTHGELTGIAPDLTYTPEPNYYGPDGFSFSVNDGQASSEPAQVSIDVTPVNDAPVAYPQSVTTQRSQPVAITLEGSDIDGDDLTFTVIAHPSHGSLTGIAPDLVYTPEELYTGTDSFTFGVGDGVLNSPEATVDIEISEDIYLIFIPMTFR